jgi:hypothetical protein
VQEGLRLNLESPASNASPLAYRDFRALFLTTALWGFGWSGELVALGWYLLESTDSPFIVGVGVAYGAELLGRAHGRRGSGPR